MTHLEAQPEDLELYKADGCRNCNQTGYHGRTALHEILSLTPELKELIVEGASTTRLNDSAQNAGMISLEACGLKKVARGTTSLQEAMRVTKVDAGYKAQASAKEV